MEYFVLTLPSHAGENISPFFTQPFTRALLVIYFQYASSEKISKLRIDPPGQNFFTETDDFHRAHTTFVVSTLSQLSSQMRGRAKGNESEKVDFLDQKNIYDLFHIQNITGSKIKERFSQSSIVVVVGPFSAADH